MTGGKLYKSGKVILYQYIAFRNSYSFVYKQDSKCLLFNNDKSYSYFFIRSEV